jgi:hypothetical protein
LLKNFHLTQNKFMKVLRDRNFFSYNINPLNECHTINEIKISADYKFVEAISESENKTYIYYINADISPTYPKTEESFIPIKIF